MKTNNESTNFKNRFSVVQFPFADSKASQILTWSEHATSKVDSWIKFVFIFFLHKEF